MNVFGVGFIGSPAMNFIRASLERENGGYATTFGNTRIQLTKESIAEHQDIGRYAGQELTPGIRLEDMEEMRLTAITGDSECITVSPQVIGSVGSEKYVYFSLPRGLAANPESGEKRRKGEGIRDGGSLYLRKGAALLTNTDSP